jgi:hypothetical protein
MMAYRVGVGTFGGLNPSFVAKAQFSVALNKRSPAYTHSLSVVSSSRLGCSQQKVEALPELNPHNVEG